MAFEITIPRLGWSMEEGKFLGWLKREGDFVRAGEALFELEGEKATQEIEAVDSGLLRIPPGSPQAGATLPVGAVLGYLVAEGESVPAAGPPSTAPPASSPTIAPPATPAPVASAAVSAPVSAAGRAAPRTPPAVAPSVRRLARQLGVDLATCVATAAAGRITSDDVQSRARQGSESQSVPAQAKSSPRARRVALELGIEWRGLRGSGRGGRVRERDVRQAAASAVQGQSLSPRRRAIADRMLKSRERTVPVTLCSQADATNLVSLRTQFKAAALAVAPSYTDIIVKLVASALEKHPDMAACWQNDKLARPAELNLGIAVDTPDGLLVPVIRNAAGLSLLELAERSRTLVGRARAGQLSLAEMQGGAFTITNLGAYGIDAFTPVINYPETAILGLGAIRRMAVVYQGQCAPRDQITLSLSFDHRAVDGAPAARFLKTVCEAIENPSAWLLLGP